MSDNDEATKNRKKDFVTFACLLCLRVSYLGRGQKKTHLLFVTCYLLL